MSETLLYIVLSLLIGNLIGYQYAKWKYKGELDILFWKIYKRKQMGTKE